MIRDSARCPGWLAERINDSGGVNVNNGVCYCAVENLIIGSDVTDPEGSFKVFYDDLEEKMYFRGYFKLGVQYLYSSLVQWGIVT